MPPPQKKGVTNAYLQAEPDSRADPFLQSPGSAPLSPTLPVRNNAYLSPDSSLSRRPTQNELNFMAPLSELVNNPQDVRILKSDNYLNAALRMGNTGYRTVTFLPTQTIAPQENEMPYATAAHEFVHIAQAQGLPSKRDFGFRLGAIKDDPKRYDYGGANGLEAMARQGQSVTDLNPEQQASALQEYARLKRVTDAFPELLQDGNIRKKFLLHEQLYRQALAAKFDAK